MSQSLLRAAHGLLIAAARQYATAERHLLQFPVDGPSAWFDDVRRAESLADEALQGAARAYASVYARTIIDVDVPDQADLEESFDTMSPPVLEVAS